MKRHLEFIDVLLRGAGPSPELLGAFALGLLVVGVLGNATYDLLTAPAESLPVIWRPLLAAGILTGLAYVLFRRDRQRGPGIKVEVDESRLAPPHAGLIWLLGPGSFDHLLFALQHHCQGGGGAHCWLVMQDVKPVREAFGQLSQRLSEGGVPTRLHPVYIPRLDVEAAYGAVRSILEREAIEEGLGSGDVIADITGGIKPLTAGMLLAALTTGCSVEYVESERDAQGQPLPDTLRVVLVDTTFYLAEEK